MSWEELLNGLWAASLSASIMILVVLILRMLFQSRTPRRVFCLLWDAVLVRLLIPGSLPSPLSVWRWLPASAIWQAALHPVGNPAVKTDAVKTIAVKTDAVKTVAVTAGSAAGGVPVSANAQPGAAALLAPVPSAETILTAIWLMAALALAAWLLWSHLRFHRVCADSLPCGNGFVRDWLARRPLRRHVQVRTSDRIAAPLTYGVLHPTILLPSGMKWTDSVALSCILEHEFGHIRRFDTLRKALLAAVLCLHWFNPLVWVLQRLSSRDMELNCDEAVTARGVDRVKYAQTLLDMEEDRVQWGLSGSHFSQNALEERIRCMMKRRKNSIAALAAVLLVMSVTVTAFAAGAPKTGSTYNHFEATEGETIIRAQGDACQYSLDGGKTWLSEEDYRAQYGESQYQVEWWTAEEYAAWLEEEKQVLQHIIGERGYTSTDGWFTWDQARVDEAVALYERILEDIQNGALYSKSIVDENGDAVEEVALASWTLAEGKHLTTNEEEAVVAEDAAVSETVDESALLEALQKFGIERSGNQLTYKGQYVRRLVDGAAVGENGYAIRYIYTNPEGTVDVHTLRAAAYSRDGSYDPLTKLIGVAAEGENGFDQNLIDCAKISHTQVTLEKWAGAEMEAAVALGPYQQFGLSYECEQNRDGEMQLRMNWNGKPVHSLYDTETGVWIANNMNGTDLPEDAVELETVYEEGVLIGLRETASGKSGLATYAQGSGDGSGTTIEAVLAQYQPYGLSCALGEDGQYLLTWNGQAVSSFSDVRPDGGVFSYQVPHAEDGVRVHTEYDAAGMLVGLSIE